VGANPTVAGGSDSATEERPLRADAQRNRARILDAAEVVFAAEGIEVPVDTIAEKAGVGVGTLYRHFPTKEKLCEAILLERLAGLTEDARAQADAADPGAAFFAFLNHMAELSSSKRDLIAAVMGAGLEFDEAAADVKADLREAVGVLLQRAQSAGSVRSDVTADTVVSLVVGTCQAAASHVDSCAGRPAPAVLRRQS
jgi:AcrR family transcriptional regulator